MNVSPSLEVGDQLSIARDKLGNLDPQPGDKMYVLESGNLVAGDRANESFAKYQVHIDELRRDVCVCTVVVRMR